MGSFGEYLLSLTQNLTVWSVYMKEHMYEFTLLELLFCSLGTEFASCYLLLLHVMQLLSQGTYLLYVDYLCKDIVLFCVSFCQNVLYILGQKDI